MLADKRQRTESEPSPATQTMEISEELLGMAVLLYSVGCLSLLAMVRKFIYSKPPGRRMVGNWKLPKTKYLCYIFFMKK